MRKKNKKKKKKKKKNSYQPVSVNYFIFTKLFISRLTAQKVGPLPFSVVSGVIFRLRANLVRLNGHWVLFFFQYLVQSEWNVFFFRRWCEYLGMNFFKNVINDGETPDKYKGEVNATICLASLEDQFMLWWR